MMNEMLADGHKKHTKGLTYWLSQKKIRTNLLIMCMLWLVASFDYYLINYMAGHFKKAYSVVITSQIAEMVAKVSGGVLFSLIGVRKGMFTVMFVASLAGAVMVVGGE